MASSITVATTAALTTEARGRAPFTEGPPSFITANQQVGGGAALYTGEGKSGVCSPRHSEKLLFCRSSKPTMSFKVGCLEEPKGSECVCVCVCVSEMYLKILSMFKQS